MKEIPLTQGKIALVDDEDFERLSQWKWHARKTTQGMYAARTEGNQKIFMHNELIFVDAGKEVDHKDGDGLNNQKGNLRPATHVQNTWNSKRRSDNSSGFKGVGRWSVTSTVRGKKYTYTYWRARIRLPGSKNGIVIGYFSDKEVAARAYDVAALKHFGEFAKLNFPNKQ